MATRALIGTYRYPMQVELALGELIDAGFDPRTLSVVETSVIEGGPSRNVAFGVADQRDTLGSALRGALAGAVVLGILGLIAAAIVVAVMRGGWAFLPLAGMFNGVAAGAVIGGIAGAIKGRRKRSAVVELNDHTLGDRPLQIVASTEPDETEDVRLALVATHPDDLEIRRVA